MSDATINLDIEKINSLIKENFEKNVALLSKQMSFRYILLIYRLMIRGKVKKSDLAECSELSEQRLYQIKEDFEKFITDGKHKELFSL